MGAGTVSLGALLASCGDEEGPEAQTDAATSDPFDGAPTCRVTPEATEGPYYFDVDKVRSDIREGRDGAKLRLAIRVRDADSCEPISNAVVDIWHCDALGSYSGFDEEGTFLRGAQVTTAKGAAEFVTVYPGWYPGRTVHIHAKVHLDNQTVLTTQLYFADDFTTAVYEQEPYSTRPDRDVLNDSDGIFDDKLVMKLSEEEDGYLGVISFDVERT